MIFVFIDVFNVTRNPSFRSGNAFSAWATIRHRYATNDLERLILESVYLIFQNHTRWFPRKISGSGIKTTVVPVRRFSPMTSNHPQRVHVDTVRILAIFIDAHRGMWRGHWQRMMTLPREDHQKSYSRLRRISASTVKTVSRWSTCPLGYPLGDPTTITDNCDRITGFTENPQYISKTS